jgi:hypothetical protein
MLCEYALLVPMATCCLARVVCAFDVMRQAPLVLFLFVILCWWALM